MANILNGPKLENVPNSTIGEFFFERANSYCDRTCQIDATLDKHETYGNVKKRSIRLALELQKRGVTSEDVVVLCTKVTLDNVIPIVSTFFLGAKVANLDPTLSQRHTTHLLGLVSPKIIFVEEESLGLIEESLKCARIKVDIVVFGTSTKYPMFGDLIKPQPNENIFKPIKVDVHEISVIFFSSGTTGLPKAICHSNYSFLNTAFCFYQANLTSDACLSFTSFYWISGMLLLVCSFISGSHRIFCGSLEAEKTFKIIQKHKVTLIFMAPLLTYKLTSFDRRLEYNTSSLRTVITGGTPINTVQLKRLSATFPSADVLLAYGLTEAGIITVFNPTKNQKLIKTKLGSCGKLSSGMMVKIVDLSTGKALGPKQKGELCVKAPSVMVGYYKTDTSSAFDGDGFLKTGDIAYYDEDECFYVVERLKEMFKYMSWHVVPSAIEQVLLEHPAVKEAVVFGTPRSEEEGEVPTACVVLKDGCRVSGKEIEEFVSEKVSDYEKLRGGVVFVDELQKTPSGKLMRREIRNSMLMK